MNSVSNFTTTNTTAIIRCDLNVPMKDGLILDNNRILASIETIKYLHKSGAKIIIVSHYGRPNGEKNEKYSLKPIHKELEKILEKQITFIEEIKSEDSLKIVKNGKFSEIFMLENLRFYKEEEDNDENFAQIIANYGTIYVNDAFACSHRKHSSTHAITNYLPSFSGLNLDLEILKINEILDKKKKTLCVIGGSKISSKIKLIDSMMKKCSSIFIGGGMANTFFAAKGFEVGFSLFEKSEIDTAKAILKEAEKLNCKVLLPIDVMTSKSSKKASFCKIITTDLVEKDDYILDCGPMTNLLIKNELESCENVIWNGPLGVHEIQPFNVGSESFARSVAYLTSIGKIKSIVGGGDAVSCAKASGVANQFSFVSTAGGAFLEYVQDGTLVALEPLMRKIEM